MPIITGLNISSDGGRTWRAPLRTLIKQVTAKYWEIPEDWVECNFPHDPSTPMNESSTAAFIVDVLFNGNDRGLHRRQAFAEVLRIALEPQVNCIRKTKNSRVEVVVPPYSQELSGFSATSTESHKS